MELIRLSFVSTTSKLYFFSALKYLKYIRNYIILKDLEDNSPMTQGGHL